MPPPTLTFSALREYRTRVAAMLDDPDCGGELFSLGVALLDFAVLRISEDRAWKTYAERAWGEGAATTSRYSIERVLRSDIRRYDGLIDTKADRTWYRQCGAPMVRRQGPCGRSASRQTMLTDVDTGRRQWIAACSRHHEWFDARVVANRKAVGEADPIVVPAANAGGVLARHIPEIDWENLWVKLDPTWKRPPESEPEEVPLKPRLRLVLGEGA